MDKKIIIAVDAMGGDNSPKKVIDGIVHHFTKNKNTFYKILELKIKLINLFQKILRKKLMK